MDWANVLLTSLSLSVDACSVNAANGIREKDMKISKMAFISLIFGIFQFGMPTIGYLAFSPLKSVLEKAIPWIAFALLTLLSLKSFIDWLKERKEKGEKENDAGKSLGIGTILFQAVATSIDALCIGFVFLKYGVGEALLSFGIIGVITAFLSFLAVALARHLAGKLEKFAGLIAAIVFLAVGIKILLEGILL